MDILGAPVQLAGAAVITVPDLRWPRRDIETTGLLALVMAKRRAREALMVEDGLVIEGGSSSVFVVTLDGRVLTRPLSRAALPGIARLAVMKLAREEGLAAEVLIHQRHNLRRPGRVHRRAAKRGRCTRLQGAAPAGAVCRPGTGGTDLTTGSLHAAGRPSKDDELSIAAFR